MGKIIKILATLYIASLVAWGCVGDQEALKPLPVEAKSQSESGPMTASTQGRGNSSVQFRFGAVEKFPQIKANYYYVHAIPKAYLIDKSDWIGKVDGFTQVAFFLDEGSSVYLAEKKWMEDCFAEGIRLRLVDYQEFAEIKHGRVLYHDSRFTSYEAKVFVEYSYEYTYADNSKETTRVRKVFTVREERERNLNTNEPKDFVNKITVVIVNIEDDVAGYGKNP